MPIEMHHEGDDVYRLDFVGLLRRADLAACETSLAGEIGRIGSVKLLCVLTGFLGWERQGDWGDLTFYLKHGDAIERIAIVGDERWRTEALMFASADLRKAPVEFFPAGNLATARAWLSG
jgi:SpoIIAA-like